MSWVPAAIQSGANFLSGIFGNRQNERLVDKQNQSNLQLQDRANEFTRQQNELAYQRNLEMYDKNNLYNSPTAQMQRFEQSGLNKNLIYGQGSAGNTTSSPTAQGVSYQAPKMERNVYQSPSIGNVIQDYINLKTSQAQIDNVKAQTDNQRTQNALATLSLAGERDDYQTKRLAERLKNDLFKTQIDSSRATIQDLSRSYDLKLKRESRDAEKHTWDQKEYKDLRSIGIYPGDPAWLRLGAKGFDLGKSALQNLEKQIFNWVINRSDERMRKRHSVTMPQRR